MTNPVILLGTQSNGETLPVQVDATGRLVAEGLQGIQGPEGPPGPQGPPGSMELPPDPYEGALLGWLNGGLAWVGSSPIPIPENVFGPITSWDAESSVLELEGSIPSTVNTGVYVYQCNEYGEEYVPNWRTDAEWKDTATGWQDRSKLFSPDKEDLTWPLNGSGTAVIDLSTYELGPQLLEIYGQFGVSSSQLGSQRNVYMVNGQDVTQLFKDANAYQSSAWINCGTIDAQTITATAYGGVVNPTIGAIRIGRRILVDKAQSLNLRVQQVFGSNLIGVANCDQSFTPGLYLKAPAQRVAPWVLYGNDPTSLIDHLRQTRD